MLRIESTVSDVTFARVCAPVRLLGGAPEPRSRRGRANRQRTTRPGEDGTAPVCTWTCEAPPSTGAEQTSGRLLHDRDRCAAAATQVDLGGDHRRAPIPPGRSPAKVAAGHQAVDRLAGRVAEEWQVGVGQAASPQPHSRGADRGRTDSTDRARWLRPGDRRVPPDGARGRLSSGFVPGATRTHKARSRGPHGRLDRPACHREAERARVTGEDDGVDADKVDPELQRVCRGEAEQVAGQQRLLQPGDVPRAR